MKLMFVFLLTLVTTIANAYVVPTYRDIKPASQQMIEKLVLTTPVLADVDRLKNDQATSATLVTTVTTFLAQPDVARNITLTTGGTTDDCKAANVTVTGTNYYNAVITDTLAVTANQAGTTSGVKAFKTVTSISIPAQDGADCTYDFGVGDVLGLKSCMDVAGHVIQTVFNGVYEGTRATCVADVDEVEKNTCDINGTLDGAKNVEFFYMQNFRCKP